MVDHDRSLAWLAFLVAMVTVWGMAAGAPMGGLPLRCALCLGGAVAALVGVALLPGVRRMRTLSRMLLLGTLAFPAPLALAIAAWIQVN
ncbi:hypothetical protein [Streptomyces albipurpureus]|uniref:Integral membrane protein n=1 Tax=Streptomyces albipurpureus TaxID=2897419 RepID=A0ABT0UI40_9ACTN|nr:hypothetical protein [Streptomyces sp. CWNU-1]MCM2388324.1 hypothetical protein [Streptomyces sp. CWNU-1]